MCSNIVSRCKYMTYDMYHRVFVLCEAMEHTTGLSDMTSNEFKITEFCLCMQQYISEVLPII